MNIILSNYGTTLVSRDYAKEVFSKLDLTNQDIILDFSNINIATPSFLHEMLAVILEKKSPNHKISFLNADHSVETQLKKAISSLMEDSKSNSSLSA